MKKKDNDIVDEPVVTKKFWESFKTIDDIRIIPIDLIVPNSYNPNVMNDVTFNRLVDEIREIGFKVPVQVVPIDDGKFRIIDGEHRYHAGAFLSYTEIPCYILTDEKFQNEDLQKFMTMRFNVLKGKTNPEKFAALYNDLMGKYSDEALQELMAFTDIDEWEHLTKSIKESLKSAGVSKLMIEKFEKSSKELKSVDDLTILLNTIFSENGNDLQCNFLSFGLGGKTVLYVCCENEGCFYTIEKMAKTCRNSGIKIDNLLVDLLNKWEKNDVYKTHLANALENKESL